MRAGTVDDRPQAGERSSGHKRSRDDGHAPISDARRFQPLKSGSAESSKVARLRCFSDDASTRCTPDTGPTQIRRTECRTEDFTLRPAQSRREPWKLNHASGGFDVEFIPANERASAGRPLLRQVHLSVCALQKRRRFLRYSQSHGQRVPAMRS